MKVKYSHSLAILLLFAFIFIQYWPFFLKGEVIAPTDILLYFRPWSMMAPENFRPKCILRSDIIDALLPPARYFFEEIKKGYFPIWNPYIELGRPVLSLGMPFLFPIFFILFYFFSLPYAFSLLILTKLFFMGYFMFIYLKKIKLSQEASLLGSMIYMFSGFNTVWLFWPQSTVTTITPLLFLCVENLVQKPGLLYSVFLGLIISLMIYAGFPSLVVYDLYAVGLYVLFVFGVEKHKFNNSLAILKVAVCGMFAVIIAIGLSAFLIFPTKELFEFVDMDYRGGMGLAHLPIKSLLQLIFPNCWGNPVYYTWSGASNFNESSGYIGIVSLAFVCVPLLWKGKLLNIKVLYFSLLCLLIPCIVYRIGPILRWINYLPGISHNPNMRMLSMFGFAGAVSSGYGLQLIVSRNDRTKMFTGNNRSLIFPIILLVLLWIYSALYILISVNCILTGYVYGMLSIGLGAFVCIVFLVLLIFFFKERISRRSFFFFIFLLIFTDISVFTYRQNPTTSKSHFYPETPGIQYLRNHIKPNERILSFDLTLFVPGTMLYYGMGSAVSHTFYSSREKKLIESFSKGAFKTPTAVLPVSSVTDFQSPVIDLFGAKFIVLADTNNEMLDSKRFKLVYEREGEIKIYQNLSYQEAYLVQHVDVVSNFDEFFDAITSSTFKPGHLAFCEEPVPLDFNPIEGDKKPLAVVSQFNTDSVTYRTRSTSKALLVTHDLFYPGWKVFIDGKENKIYRADYVFRGVFVPAGEHEVKFVYQPFSVKLGAIISGTTALFVIIILIFFPMMNWIKYKRINTQNHNK